MKKSVIARSLGFALLAVVACAGCGGPESPAGGPSTGGPAAKRDLVETASEMGPFNTLVTSLKSTGLDTTLRGRGPYTVFAPTDEAFDKLGAERTRLMDPKNKDELRSVLEEHIVPGRLTAGDLRSMRTVRTMAGKDLPITVRGADVYVGGARVTRADVEANNGVIHGIDGVLMPK